jgi:hypothetical protein
MQVFNKKGFPNTRLGIILKKLKKSNTRKNSSLYFGCLPMPNGLFSKDTKTAILPSGFQ